jgi:ferredoxin
MFGNRNYDDALIELYDILRENDFCILGAGAFIGEHSFSYKLAANRPDAKDFEKIKSFAIDLTIKANRKTFKGDIKIKGQRPYRFYYMPKNDKDEIIDIRKVKPLTNDNCIDCKKCAEICPMNSIDKNNVKLINGICIKCGGCIKVCPVSAKYFEDVGYLFHKEELEKKYIKRLEPEYFV